MQKGWRLKNEWVFSIYVSKKPGPVRVRVVPSNMTGAQDKDLGDALACLIALWYRAKEVSDDGRH